MFSKICKFCKKSYKTSARCQQFCCNKCKLQFNGETYKKCGYSGCNTLVLGNKFCSLSCVAKHTAELGHISAQTNPPMKNEISRIKMKATKQQEKYKEIARNNVKNTQTPKCRKKMTKSRFNKYGQYCSPEGAIKRRGSISKTLLNGSDTFDREKGIKNSTLAVVKRIANGEFNTNSPIYKQGWYTSTLTENKEYYQSSYELERMKQLDEEGIYWTKKHKIYIEYTDLDGIKRYTIPDFLVNTLPKKTFEETKNQLDEYVYWKICETIKWCEENNYEYKLLFGKDIFERRSYAS